MTLEQFDRTLEYLIQVILPPNVSDDLPASPQAVLEVLEAHCEILRGRILHEELNNDDGRRRETSTLP